MKSQSLQIEVEEEREGLRKCKSEVGKTSRGDTGFLDAEMEGRPLLALSHPLTYPTTHPTLTLALRTLYIPHTG